MNTPDNKEEIRKGVCEKLDALAPDERARFSQMAIANLMTQTAWKSARTVMAYNSIGTEVSTTGLISACLGEGKTVVLPRTEKKNRQITAHKYTGTVDELEVSRFGFREPRASLPIAAPSAIDLIVVPGIAYDLDGNRLGRGAGYYDRYLSVEGMRAVKAALAFECQIVACVPVMAHDQPLDLICTESRTIIKS